MPRDDMPGGELPLWTGSGAIGPLTVIGLSPTEECAYELLLQHSPVTAVDLAAHWPHTTSATPATPPSLPEVLAGLVAKGLANPAPPDRFVAVPPDVALDALLLDQERQVDAAAAHVEQLAAAYRGHDAATPVTELVTGRRAVNQRLDALYGAARHELRRLCTDLPVGLSTGLSTGSPTDLSIPDSPAHQVACRSVYARAAFADPDRFAAVERRVAAGEQARTLPTLSLSLHLADDRLALLPLDHSDDGGDGDDTVAALVVYPGGLLDALTALFEGLWERATPLAMGSLLPDDADGSSGVDAHLVALLLSGGTDQAVARQLGIAHRTLARRVATLMTELGARTRFQAGVQAAFRDLGQRGD